jgi:Pyruvate/2-oxoacid:ferredoxin oxidoreductase gamma subunit
MIGALTKIAPVADRSCVEQAIAASVPKNKVDMNMKAFAAGFDAVSAC